jgi:hypothetical protein
MTATSNSTDSNKTVTVTTSNDEMKNLIEAVKKDGLSKDGNLSIELKDGKLQINGKEVDAAAAEKYAPFLKGKENFHVVIDAKETKK